VAGLTGRAQTVRTLHAGQTIALGALEPHGDAMLVLTGIAMAMQGLAGRAGASLRRRIAELFRNGRSANPGISDPL
jgi:hypothetical protein